MRSVMILLLALSLGGCAIHESGRSNALIAASYTLSDQLIESASRPLPRGPIIVATLVELDRLDQSSTLGRVVAEQVAARFTQRGFAVIELKLRGNVFVKQGQGELLLSREVKDLSLSHNVQAVVVGSYAASASQLFLNLKVIRPSDNEVLAAHNAALDNDGAVQQLLMN